MHSLILLYTKLWDAIIISIFSTTCFFAGKIWGFLLTKNRKITLCFICDNIEYTSKYVVKIINNHFLWIYLFYNCKRSKHIICMKTKISIVVDLSSVDKIDTRHFLFNRTFVFVSFWCAIGQLVLLILSK